MSATLSNWNTNISPRILNASDIEKNDFISNIIGK